MDPQRGKSFIRVEIIRRVSYFYGKMVAVEVAVVVVEADMEVVRQDQDRVRRHGHDQIPQLSMGIQAVSFIDKKQIFITV